MLYDIIIVGGGPAGMTAANNTAHRGLKTLLIESKDKCGGQPNWLYPNKTIKDHPGFPVGITGKELSTRLFKQAQSSGAEIKTNEEVISVNQNKENFSVSTDKSRYATKKVIIATGLLNVPRKHPVLDKHKNMHVSHKIANHDFKGKRVVIVGGGDSAFDNALQLANIAKSVSILVKGPYPKAKEDTVRLAQEKGVNVLANTEVAGLRATRNKIGHISAYNGKASIKIKADEILLCTGYVSQKKFLESQNFVLNKDGSVKVNKNFETSMRGVFAAGDVTGEIKLIAVACAEGISAAIHAFEEIKKPYWLH